MRLDDFDAVFRSSVKDRFALDVPEVRSVVLVTDMLPAEAAALETTVQGFLSHPIANDARWRTIGADEFSSVSELMAVIDAVDGDDHPDLIVCYRHLLGRQKDLKHSLGSVVDSLTQRLPSPVLLLPPPTLANFDVVMAACDQVMVVTDHLSGDDRLVNWGVGMCGHDGTLLLAHVEDEVVFERYMDIVGMIPDIDTETTRTRIRDKLLGRPRDYIADIARVLAEAEISETVVPVVTMAHALSDYKRIADEHDVHLIVMNTKDEHQLAMHGMAYAISVEIQNRPLLLL